RKLRLAGDEHVAILLYSLQGIHQVAAVWEHFCHIGAPAAPAAGFQQRFGGGIEVRQPEVAVEQHDGGGQVVQQAGMQAVGLQVWLLRSSWLTRAPMDGGEAFGSTMQIVNQSKMPDSCGHPSRGWDVMHQVGALRMPFEASHKS